MSAPAGMTRDEAAALLLPVAKRGARSAVRRHGADPADAESDALLGAVLAIDAWNPEKGSGDFLAYAGQRIGRTIVDEWRSRTPGYRRGSALVAHSIEEHVFEDGEPDALLADRSAVVEHGYAEVEGRDAVEALVRLIPDPDDRALLRALSRGVSKQDFAASHGVVPSTVSHRLARIRRDHGAELLAAA